MKRWWCWKEIWSSYILTRLYIRQLCHSACNGGKYDLGFIFEADFLNHNCNDLNCELPILFNLILETDDDTLAKAVAVKVFKNFLILTIIACLFEFDEGLSPQIPIWLRKHVNESVVPLLELNVLLRVNQLCVLHVLFVVFGFGFGVTLKSHKSQFKFEI